MAMQEIGEFKYPNRKPIILLILAVVIGMLIVRWYKNDQKMASEGKTGRWSCALFKKHNKDVQPPAVTETKVVTVQVTNQPPVLVSLRQTANSTTNSMVIEISELEEKKALVQVRKRCIEFLRQPMEPSIRDEVEKHAGRINIELVMTPAAMPEKQEYVVQPGDSLEKIARKFGTTVDLIQKSNLLSSHIIKLGDRLMVLSGKFAIKVSKSRNDMIVTLNEDFFLRYGVGTGKFGKTPVGSFVINDKIKEPVWWRPDGREIPYGNPENILGTRWMSIKASGSGTPDVKGYGIHGTWDDGSIGKAESAGCIRMRNADVEQLFVMVPMGTVVTITE